MISRILASAVAVAFLLSATAMPTTVVAQAVKKEETKKSETKKTETKKEETKEPKKLTAQQQKMKDCAVKWKDEKATKGVKGRKAYNEFMSKCLKG